MNLKTTYIVVIFLLLGTLPGFAVNSDVVRKGSAVQTDVCTPYRTNRTHRQSNMWLTITNWGYIGNDSQGDGVEDPCIPGTWAPQLEYPGGSHVQYLFQGALWIGALIVNEDGTETPRVSFGTEGWANPSVNELNPGCGDDDHIYEMTTREGAFGCGEPIYNDATVEGKTYLAVSEQDFIAVYADTLTDQQFVRDDITDGPHVPLGIKVTQVSHSWTYNYAQDFIIIDYEIENIADKYLKNLYVGLYMDSDVYDEVEGGRDGSQDDICGFRIAAVDSVTGDSVEINIAYIADNDGRPADVSTGNDFTCPNVTGTRVLRAPNPKLTTTFNWWNSNSSADIDFGPAWQIYADSAGWEWTALYGTPEGDARKYQVMGNGEFDYDQIYVCDEAWVNAHPQTLPDGREMSWQSPSGDVEDVCDGYDTRYLLSWGPLGVFDHIDQAGRLIYRLNPGEKFSMTVAIVGGEGFHQRSDPQGAGRPDPSKFNFKDLDFNALWAMRVYDNEMFDTPIYDYGSDGLPNTQDYDGSEGDGVLDTGDGWFGEDVGSDGLYAAAEGLPVVYFGDTLRNADGTPVLYPGEDEDGSENNGHLDELDLTLPWLSSFRDVDENGEINEDDILWNLQTILGDSAMVYAGPKYSHGVVGIKDWYIGHLGGNGFLDRGDGIPDFQGPPPPDCPHLSYSLTEDSQGNEEDEVVTLIWDRWAQRGEYLDPFSRRQDFEGYHIWVGNTSLENEYTLLAEYDDIDFAYFDDEGKLKTLPDPGPFSARPPRALINDVECTRQKVGNNTGFAGQAYAVGEPAEPILRDVNGDRWVSAGQVFDEGVVEPDPKIYYAFGIPCNEDGEPLVLDPVTHTWVVMDTTGKVLLGDRFIDLNGNGVWDPDTTDDGIEDYHVEYRYTVPNARPYFPRYYGVTSYDFGDYLTGTEPLETSKGCNSMALAPAGNPRNPVKVIPNPYRAYEDYTQGFEYKNSATGLSWENQDDGTREFYPQYDRRIEFANLPQKCLIRIYTVAGDLVQIVPHNMPGDRNVRWSSDYSESWDLNSRNEQQVTSGLYLFSVEDMTEENRGHIQTGKFVIIR